MSTAWPTAPACQKSGGRYVPAERLRGGSAEARAAMGRAGRYRRVVRRSRTTAGQRRVLAALELPEPPVFSDIEVSATAD